MSDNPAQAQPAQQTFDVVEHVRVPMPDGVRLSARLWIPQDTGADGAPVVVEYIPYRKRDVYRIHDSAWGRVLAGHGIAYARIDVRGCGDSEGILTDEYSDVELRDGVACIDWLARQPWSSGRVGMRGMSWGAISTLQIAAMNPPALKAIMPIAGTDNRFADDAHYLGGILAEANSDWGVLFKTVLAGPPDPETVGPDWHRIWQERLDASRPVITEWARHATDDDYWQQNRVAGNWDRIQCPAYVVAGWFDPYVNPVGRLLEKLNVPRKGFIGPWGHVYPQMGDPMGVDWASEEIRWWRHWLAGEETGIMSEPMLHAFLPDQSPRVTGPKGFQGRWVSADAWPADDSLSLHLGDGTLDAAPTDDVELSYVADEPVGTATPEWTARPPGEQSEDDARSLLFDSSPLEQDVELFGYPEVKLRVASAGPSDSIAVRLTEVTPEGASHLVSYGMLHLSQRSSPSLCEAVEPDEFYDVSLELRCAAYRFKVGHRIRLAITDRLWPMTWHDGGASEISLSTRGSRLNLPIWPGNETPTELPVDVLPRAKTRPPSPVPTTTRDQDGWVQYLEENESDYVDREVGTRLTSTHSRKCRLHPVEGGVWFHRMRRGWQRADWHCEVEATCEIRSATGGWQIRETLEAFQDGASFFSRESDEFVPERG